MSRFLLLSALLALAASARAQSAPDGSAADLYHEAARLYVGGERDAAEEAALRGLALAPDEPRLQALLDRIRQNQQQSGQDGQQNPDPQGGEEGAQDGEGEQEQDQPPQQDGSEGANPPEDDRDGGASDRPEEQQPEAEQPDQHQPDRNEEQPRPEAPRPGEGEATPESAAPVPPGTMTREEAERILNAVGADEGRLLRRTQRQPGNGRRVEKDW